MQWLTGLVSAVVMFFSGLHGGSQASIPVQTLQASSTTQAQIQPTNVLVAQPTMNTSAKVSPIKNTSVQTPALSSSKTVAIPISTGIACGIPATTSSKDLEEDPALVCFGEDILNGCAQATIGDTSPGQSYDAVHEDNGLCMLDSIFQPVQANSTAYIVSCPVDIMTGTSTQAAVQKPGTYAFELLFVSAMGNVASAFMSNVQDAPVVPTGCTLSEKGKIISSPQNAPALISVSPSSGPPGTQVTLTGSGFNPQASYAVFFGNETQSVAMKVSFATQDNVHHITMQIPADLRPCSIEDDFTNDTPCLNALVMTNAGNYQIVFSALATGSRASNALGFIVTSQ